MNEGKADVPTIINGLKDISFSKDKAKLFSLLITYNIDDTMVYVDVPPKFVMTADLSSDLPLSSQWEKNWLIAFNASETKLVTFYHRPTTTLDECSLKKSPYFERLLCLKLNPDLKWNSYLQSIT